MPVRAMNHVRSWLQKGGGLFSRSGQSSGSALETLSRLPGLSENLETVCREAEPRFVDLGERLQMIHFDASALSQRTLNTAGLMAGDSNEGLSATITKFAKASLAELESCQTDVADNLECVDAVVGHLGSLHGMTDVVEKIALYLRIVGLNIGVECSRSAESQEMFGVVALDTKTLSEKIIEVVEEIRVHAESARASQISAHAEISGGVNHLAHLTRGARENVERAVGDAERLMALSHRALQSASEHSRRISGQVGEVVVGIQFHDNMSQRIDHICSSLHYIEELRKNDAPGKKKEMARKLGSAHSIVTLQAAQLEQVIDELRGVYQKNMDAFEEIIHEVDQLANSLSAFDSDGEKEAASSRETSEEDPFAALESALGRLHELLATGRSLFDRMRDAAGNASDATARLSAGAEQVRGISMETHIMSLNAIVKAAHLGERGLALEVLAQEVKKLSDQSSQFTGDVNGVLESITGSSFQLGERSDAAPGEEGVETGAGGVSLEGGVGEISMAYAKFREDSSEVSRKSATLTSLVSEAKSGLEFLPALADKLTGLLEQLEEMGRALTPWAGRAGEELESEAEELAHKYTMDRERIIHGQIIPGASNAESPLAPDQTLIGLDDQADVVFFDSPAQESPSEDDLGDVEFFDAPSGEKAAPGDDLGDVEFFDAPPQESSPPGDDLGDVEFFDAPSEEDAAPGEDSGDVEFFDAPAPPPDANASASAHDDLGDNVDLFDAPMDEPLSKPDKKKNDEEDLGDNVELF